VIATNSVLCDLTKQIAADTVDLNCLIKAGQDPHVYEPNPEDRKAIESANLILYGGYGFEPDLVKIVKATSNSASKVAVAELAVPKPLMGEHHEHGEAHDHEKDAGKEKDHDHGKEAKATAGEAEEPDPHVWHNAKNGIQMAEVIATNLKKVAPDKAATYDQNLQKLRQELQQIDGWIKTQIATIPADQRKLITTHDALGYFANAYNIPVEGALKGLSTDEKPTAARVKELVEEIKAAKVPTIFAEVSVNPKLIETVAKEAKVKVSDRPLYADGLGEPGSSGETYPKMLVANTQTIVEGLDGRYTPFKLK
jgi:manganese/iron transport system substrate-binding protein